MATSEQGGHGITGKTKVYGIIGSPVSHSLSPVIHNTAFAALGLDAVYIPLPASDPLAALAGLRSFAIAGASVTIPHKEQVITGLDFVDPLALKIGAVNTIVNQEGKLHGYNTDWVGATEALATELGLSGAKVLLLGAGGSARAIAFGLIEAGAELVIANRSSEKAKKLALSLGCEWLGLEAAAGSKADALINSTSLGMSPDDRQSPFPADKLDRFQVVMDIVYSPLVTRLLQDAEKAGCRTVSGIEMLVFQAAAQFRLWTGRQMPLSLVREKLSLVLGAAG